MSIPVRPLSPAEFAPYGDVIAATGEPDRIINQGLCGRFHDLATLDFGPGGRAGISVFDAVPRSLPYDLELVERHPDGSQAFLPMTLQPFLVIVAEGREPVPGQVHAFITGSGEGVNFHRGTWHGVLTPLAAPGLFAVVDRIGETPNLEEYHFPEPVTVG